jgi:hypothetical protein
MTGASSPTVIAVHAASADAPGFPGVIRELATSGDRTAAPPDQLRSLAFGAAAISAACGQ